MGLLLFAAVLVTVLATGFVTVDGFGLLLAAAVFPWFFVLNLMPFVIWIERKGSAYIQDRAGPERAFIPGVGIRLAGLVHNIADLLKLATKEQTVPRHVNRPIYVIAPALAVVVALTIGAVIPYAHPLSFEDGTVLRLQALDLNIGVLWLLAVSSMGVYSIMLGSWASNNKYSQLGGIRAGASMVSYELTFGLALAGLFLVFNTPRLLEIVEAQSGTWLGFLPKWGIVVQPVGFLLFLVSALAETNRTPFDLAEAESELVAGYHTEYGGFKFAMYFMAEYVSIIVQCLLIATLFFGGYQILPWVDTHAFLSEPRTATAVLAVLLSLVVAGGGLVGWKLLAWDRTNRRRWSDARAREGKVLAVLLGFGPAATALLGLAFWGVSTLGADAAVITAGVVEVLTLTVKTLIFCWLFVWIRWTIPRFRYDQLMGLGWKILVPLGIVNLILTGLLVQLGVF